MSLPAVITLCLYSLSFGMALVRKVEYGKDGELLPTTLTLLIQILILYWGGFLPFSLKQKFICKSGNI